MNGEKPAQPRRHFQFSLRVLLLLTAVAALTLAWVAHRQRYERQVLRPTAFYNAIRNGDLAAVQRLLDLQPSLAHEFGSHFPYEMSPLHAAIFRGANPAVLDRLLVERPDVGVSSYGRTVIGHAATCGQFWAASKLIEAGADPNVECELGPTPLFYVASSRGNIQNLLKHSCVQLDKPAYEGKTAAIYATLLGRGNSLTALLNAGADINWKTKSGKTALHFCLGDGSNPPRYVFRHLLAYGADLTAVDNQGFIPGQQACGKFGKYTKYVWWHEIEKQFDADEHDALDPLFEKATKLESSGDIINNLGLITFAIERQRAEVVDYLLSKTKCRETTLDYLPPGAIESLQVLQQGTEYGTLD